MTAGEKVGRRLAALVAAPGWPGRLLMLAAIVMFYALTAAGNLSEPDDAFAFAYRAERFALTHFSDPRLLGYHVLGRVLWLGSEALGLGIRGLEILRGISVLGAAACLWLMFRILVRDLGVAALPAFLSTALLAFSYGFWRYAAEADVYVPAMALCAAILHLLLQSDTGWRRHAAIGALAGLCVLFYQPNAIPLFLVFPWLLLRNGVGSAFAYCAAGSLAAIAGYLTGYFAYWDAPLDLMSFRAFLAQRSEEFMVAPLSLKTLAVSIVRSGFALGHDLVSSNWVFGLPHAERVVQRIFGAHVIEEELFLARHAGVLVYLPLLILPLAGAAAWRVLAAAWPLRLQAVRRRPLPLIGLWAGATALVIGRLNPGGIEAWIVVLLPLSLLVAVGIVAPACERRGTRAVWLMLVAFALHNWLGGMALVQSRQSDLTYLRGAWAAANAQQDDLVIVVGNVNLAESLRYRGRARVEMVYPFMLPMLADALLHPSGAAVAVPSGGRDFRGTDLVTLVRTVVQRGGRVIVFGDFFMQGDMRYGIDSALAGALAELKLASPARYRAADGSTTHVLAGPAFAATQGAGQAGVAAAGAAR